MPFRYHSAMVPLLVPAEEIRPNPRNPNNGDVDEIVTSLLINGCYRPIFASERSKMIVAGHNLYAALLSLGQKAVPVSWVDSRSEADELRMNVADNWIARLARVDPPLLVAILDELKGTPEGLYGTGVDERQLDKLREIDLPPDEFTLPDPEPEIIPGEFRCPSCGYEWSGRPKRD